METGLSEARFRDPFSPVYLVRSKFRVHCQCFGPSSTAVSPAMRGTAVQIDEKVMARQWRGDSREGINDPELQQIIGKPGLIR